MSTPTAEQITRAAQSGVDVAVILAEDARREDHHRRLYSDLTTARLERNSDREATLVQEIHDWEAAYPHLSPPRK